MNQIGFQKEDAYLFKMKGDNMKVKKITAMLLAFVLIVLQIPFVAAGGSGDTTVSSTLVVTDNNDQPTSGYTVYKAGQVTVTRFEKSGNYKITGTSSKEVAEKILVAENFEGSITIKNIQLFYNDQINGKAPIEIDPSAKITLFLEGDNSIRAPQHFPAIEFASDDIDNITGQLTIDSHTDGYLYALGGGSDAAGIGGASKIMSDKIHTANIEIKGGRISTSSFGIGGAGIGSGANGDANNIVISGGTVTAKSNSSKSGGGAAIGSGEGGTASNIFIRGGYVIADTSSRYSTGGKAAAIGPGSYGKLNNVEISGGNITTITAEGVGIGAGVTYAQTSGGTITITGGTITTQRDSENQIGIGSTNGTDTITDIIVSGGSIQTGGFSIPPKDTNGQELALLQVNNASNPQDVVSVFVDETNYDVGDTTADHFYLYVPKCDHKIYINYHSSDSQMIHYIWTGTNFEIDSSSQQKNHWVTQPGIANWKYEQTASTPYGEAAFGDVVFTFCDTKDGMYTDRVPSNPGHYFMKATVVPTQNYTGLDEIVEFIIEKGDTFIMTDYLPTTYDYSGYELDLFYDVYYATIGSTATAQITWSKQTAPDKWVSMGTACPIDAGVYQADIYVPADNNYSAVRVQHTVTISQVANRWVQQPSIDSWLLGQTPGEPTAQAAFGTVVFSYSDSIDGTYTEKQPTKTGTWYLKATVEGTDNYSMLTQTVTFTISCPGHRGGTSTCVSQAICEICGEKYGELGSHHLEYVAAQPPIHTATECKGGVKEHYICTVCEKLFTDSSANTQTSMEQLTEQPPVHVYDQKVMNENALRTPATCTDDATYYYSCICGKVGNENYFTEMGTAIGHHYEEKRIEPGYSHEGAIQQVCTRCGDVKSTESIPALNIENRLADVANGQWFTPFIAYCLDEGLMSGQGDKDPAGREYFRPDRTMTRAELVTVLYNMEGRPTVEFKDVFDDVTSEKWFASAIVWAYDADVVSGIGDNRFAPDENISRQDLAAILYRYAAYKGIEMETGNAEEVLGAFSDAKQVSSYALDAMAAMNLAGVITGDGDRLKPKDNATRGEVASMISRYVPVINHLQDQ